MSKAAQTSDVVLFVNIDVSDLERATSFYTTAFGFRVGRRLGSGGVELLGAAAPVYLLQKAAGTLPYAEAEEPRGYGRHWTPVHLDVVVTDLEASLARAEAAGGHRESERIDQAWGSMVRLSDPFGNGFCLVQMSEQGYDAP